MVLLNQPAPDFVLDDQTGQTHRLADLRGQYVLLYFYPRDLTPGCTTEACAFRDMTADFEKAGVRVFGVSGDSVKTHALFAETHALNFPLLADTDSAICRAYGVWKEKIMYGKKVMGIARESFLIDPNGIVIRHYAKVQPAEHPAEVLKDVTR